MAPHVNSTLREALKHPGTPDASFTVAGADIARLVRASAAEIRRQAFILTDALPDAAIILLWGEFEQRVKEFDAACDEVDAQDMSVDQEDEALWFPHHRCTELRDEIYASPCSTRTGAMILLKVLSGPFGLEAGERPDGADQLALKRANQILGSVH